MYKEGNDMKKLRMMLILTLTLAMTVAGMTVAVSADTATDLESMKVYAVDAAGNKTEVPMDFSSTTYSYDLTVLSTTVSIEIEATPADSTSTWSIEKDGINTKMDFGTNLTVVDVTSAAGVVNKYTLNTTKLTEAEEATYEAPTGTNDDNSKTDKKDSDKTVTVGKKEMKISSSFSKSDIPEGFTKSTAEYDGEKYSCIKGEVKDLTAFYLYNDDTEGFYIYDSDNDSFYVMNNIQIKSRMYTIVNPDDTDGLLNNYDKKTVTIIDQEVKAWVLDEEEGMYLVYAMNWNGDTSLYCYDDNEKCFQRYLVSADANTQAEAANTAYENLQKKYNSLVDKYNILLKILCGLVIVIIILIFVIINLAINKKEKKVKADKGKKKKNKEKYDSETDDEDSVRNEEAEEDGEKAEEPAVLEEAELEIPENDKLEEIEIVNQEEIIAGEKTDGDEIAEEAADVIEESKEKEPKRKIFGRKNSSDRTYGDEPTFGTDEQSEDDFYGGEIEDEDEILIDITDDEPKAVTQEEIDKNTETARQESEEDLKETLKSMLPDEQDEDDDDDDFEFIDLN